MKTREAAALALGASLASAQSKPKPAIRFAIGTHSYGEAWKAAKEGASDAPFHDAFSFLRYAHGIGADGVQTALGNLTKDEAKTLREYVERHDLGLEAQTALPREESDVARFEDDLRTAKEVGAGAMRVAMLMGRRYENFDTAEAFREFADRSWRSLTLAEPIARKHGVRLAVENHKDWLIEEMLGLLRRIDSPFVGVCVDTGNSIALLEDPMAVIRAYAPFAVSVHLKDMAVEESAEGFLLSEVPIGQGFLDLKEMIRLLAEGKPRLQCNIEMITRDPLSVPCLTAKYWATFAERRASELATALASVRRHASPRPLPRVKGLGAKERRKLEDDNVRAYVQACRDLV